MRPIQTSELLRVWEIGREQDAARRALTLLAAGCPDASLDELARLPIGRRDGLLLTLREWTFGPRLAGLAECPSCHDRLELEFAVSDVLVPATPAEEPAPFSHDEYQVRFRLPNSADLSALAYCNDPELLRTRLLERCVLQAHAHGEERSLEQLPRAAVEAVAARMAEEDPQADIQLALTCPSCRHDWTTAFDIVGYFWKEIEAWAERLLHDVHTLAGAYGWRESDILALSTLRRQIYLDLVRG